MVMFTLLVRLRAPEHEYGMRAKPLYEGLKALDFRRAHGMPDGVTVPPPDASWSGDAHGLKLPVGEAFARLHFGPSEITRTIFVDVEDLLPGEACIVGVGGVPTPEDDWHRVSLGLTPGMSADRALMLGALAYFRNQAQEARKEAEKAKEEASYQRREAEDLRRKLEDVRVDLSTESESIY